MDKLTWVFLLLPGFICTSVIGSIVELPQWSEFQLTYYSVILSIVTGVLAWPVAEGLNWLVGRAAPAWRLKRITYLFFGVSVAFAVLLGVVLGAMAQRDETLRIVRAIPGMPPLDKSSAKRPLVLILGVNNKADTEVRGLKTHGMDGRPAHLQQEKAYLRLGVKDGPTYEGWARSFAHGDAVTELYLSPACRVDDKSGVVSVIPGAGVIVMESEVSFIELIDASASECRRHFFR
ncbi:MAG: hypothetical protein IV094_11510 [Vitreoscilla sp.]|nr:hypothetical protein [Vitreoscilla sp.]